MSEAEGIRGIVVAHGEMARGLVDAVRKISGVEEGILIPVSNEGKSPQALLDELEELPGRGGFILFTDLTSGSCALAARKCSRGERHMAAVTGVNLPILLDFVFHRELPLEELLARLPATGQNAIGVVSLV